MKDLISGAMGTVFGIMFLLAYFPGGTIAMALSCSGSRLDGWDWILSVFIPFYGLITAMFC